MKINEVCNSSQPCNLSFGGAGGSLAGGRYNWRDLRFTNGTLDLNITEAENASWLEKEVWYWDNSIIPPDFYNAPEDTATLNSWDKGYFIKVFPSNVQLLRRN